MMVSSSIRQLMRTERKFISNLSSRGLSTATHEILRTPTTHEVFNQSQPFENVNFVQSEKTVKESIEKMIQSTKNQDKIQIDWKSLEAYGNTSGAAEMMELANLAEKNIPTLRQFDNYGRRIDVIDYHPAYHQLMTHGIENGVCATGFRGNKSGSHITRGILAYFENQIESGHCCPLTMTAAVIPVLLRSVQAIKSLNSSHAMIKDNVDWIQEFINRIYTQRYDPRNLPIEEKYGATMGMSMTEKQGGSDVRTNTTMATPIDNGVTGLGASYQLVGHKWFTSAPMCDGFLTLAKTPNSEVPSCFLVPRWLPKSAGGHRNSGFRVMRLKNKLADRANASSEVEYHNSFGVMVGEEGKGVKTIIEMVQATRWDCTLGSAGSARRALQVALNHTNSRSAFGKVLNQQPLMQNVLTDLAVESEAATIMAMRMTAAFDATYNNNPSIINCNTFEEAQEYFRIGVTVSKYYVTKRLPNFTYECMESLGGNGFVEDWPLAKLFRHSPLNAIWEGSGNVIALDILRGIKSLPFLLSDIKQAKGLSPEFDRFYDSLEKSLYFMGKDLAQQKNVDYYQRGARLLADQLSIAMQASILLRYGDENVTKAYIQSRLPYTAIGSGRGLNFGGMVVFDEPLSRAIIERNMPVFN